MRRRLRASNILLGAAVAALAGALFVYASWIWSWLHPAPPAAVLQEPPRTERPAGRELAEARSDFRLRYLDPRAHMALAAALDRAGLYVDAFYVLSAARSFFGDEEFLRAHDFVVVRKGVHFLDGRPFDPSPVNEALLKERLARSPGDLRALNYMAHISAARGDIQGALRLIDQGLGRDPRERALRLFGAELFSRTLGDFSSAVLWYGKLADSAPDSDEGKAALNELGRISLMRQTGRDAQAPAAAAQLLRDIQASHQDSPSAFTALGLATLARGEAETVRALVKDTLERSHNHAGALAMDGALAINDRAPEPAIKSFAAAWRLNPSDLYIAEKLAQLHVKHRADAVAALPFYIAIYLQRPGWEDNGEPVEAVIRRILDAYREDALRNLPAPLLGKHLRSEDAALRAQACERAAQAMDPRWIDDLGALLDDDTELVRRSADYALFRIAQAFREQVLARRLRWIQAPSPFTRTRGLNLFADIDKQNTFPEAVRALSDPSPAVRFLAKTMVMDHYYQGFPGAEATVRNYLDAEKDKTVLALYARLAPTAPPAPQAAPGPAPPRPRARPRKPRTRKRAW